MRNYWILLSSLFILIGCQDFNSNSSDQARFSGFANTDKGRAMAVLNDKCVSCHTSTIHNSWTDSDHVSESNNNAPWIREGLITVSGQPFLNSKLINRLINYGSDMPQGGSELSGEDLRLLCVWINPAEDCNNL